MLTIRKSTIGYSQTKGRLPETATQNPIDKFVIPLSEEVVKLALIALCTNFASGPLNRWPHFILVACVFTLNKLVCNYVTFNPINYKTRFRSFIRIHNKYLDHKRCQFRKKSISSTFSEGKMSLSLQGSLDDQILLNEKPIFQNISFHDPTKQSPPMEIYKNGNTAHLDLIDRLYSVSPKDTLHLLYGDCDYKQPEFSLLLSKTSNNYQAIPHLDELNSICDSGDASFYDSLKRLEIQNPAASTDFPSSNLSLSFKWFSWLLPLEISQTPVLNSTNSAVIKKKLSTYTLNTESSSVKSIHSRKLFGSFDLESQVCTKDEKVINSHTFQDFAAFANKYLDFWSPNLGGIIRVLDPAFMKFGVPLNEFSSLFFIMHLLSSGLWQYTSVLLLAFPFCLQTALYRQWALILPLIAIIKLFIVNYLHSQCTLSYRFSIIIEISVNMGLAVLAGFLYYDCHISY